MNKERKLFMIDLKKQIKKHNEKEEDKKKLERELNSHKKRKEEEEKLITIYEEMIKREKEEINETENEIIAKIKLGDLIDELTTLTGITQYKTYINLAPNTIPGCYTKEMIIKEALNHFQTIHIYIKGIEKIDDETDRTYFKYDLNLPTSLIELEGNGRSLIECCTLITKGNQYTKDRLENTCLIIEKEIEPDIICNLTLKELKILSKKISKEQLELLNTAINNCLEKNDIYINPKQMRKEK